jgi:hypothetical protein
MVPAASAGLTAVTEVSEVMVKDAAGTPPKSTCVVPSRFVPAMLTEVPPPVVPEEVPRLPTVGAGSAV